VVGQIVHLLNPILLEKMYPLVIIPLLVQKYAFQLVILVVGMPMINNRGGGKFRETR